MREEKGFTLIELLIVVAIIGIIAAIAIPSLLNAVDRARQTTTVNRITTLGGHIEQYIMDFNTVGAPKVGNDINALELILNQTEINMNKSALVDGWGVEIIIDMDGTMAGRRYTVMSYGSDYAAGPAPATPGIISRFSEDIIWSRGVFLQRPVGAQVSN